MFWPRNLFVHSCHAPACIWMRRRQQVRPCDCVITCNNLPWRWTLFCISISYVTNTPKGQKLMVDEIACNFLPPTTFTMLLNTHTHTVSVLCVLWCHRHQWISILPIHDRLVKIWWGINGEIPKCILLFSSFQCSIRIRSLCFTISVKEMGLSDPQHNFNHIHIWSLGVTATGVWSC